MSTSKRSKNFRNDLKNENIDGPADIPDVATLKDGRDDGIILKEADNGGKDEISPENVKNKCKKAADSNSKTLRALKKLQFDNKYYNLDKTEADFTCVECGETFLYEVQLKSHGVYDHGRSKSPPSASESREAATTLNYRCNICSKTSASLKAYLRHFDRNGCKDTTKRRLKTSDTCVCLLCGFATPRNQIHSHIRTAHSETNLTPNEAENVFSCPMCTSTSGGNVVHASGQELLLHLSTWHPAAILLVDGTPCLPSAAENVKIRRTRQQSIKEKIRSAPRYCFVCRTKVSPNEFRKHFGACKGSSGGLVKKLKKRLENSKKNQQRLKEISSKQSPQRKTATKRLSKTIIDDVNKDAEFTTSDANDNNTFPSPPDHQPGSSSVYPTIVRQSPESPDSESKKRFKRAYACRNCKKEFHEPLSFFVHSVNGYCHGVQGSLPSPCPLCGEKINTVPAMLEHVRRYHCDRTGLRAEKTAKVEYGDLACEIMGFTHICSTCYRGFYWNMHCNTGRTHSGSKFPLQQKIKCNMCGKKVKGSTQLSLHLWSMHGMESAEIKKLLDGLVSSRNEKMARENFAKIGGITENFLRETYESAEGTTNCTVPNAQFRLRCTLCLARFASMDTLKVHVKELHQDSERDYDDIQSIAKTFFERQRDPMDMVRKPLLDHLLPKNKPAISTNTVEKQKGSPKISGELLAQKRKADGNDQQRTKYARISNVSSGSTPTKISPTPLPPPPPLKYGPALAPSIQQPMPAPAAKVQEVIVLDDDDGEDTSSRLVISEQTNSSINRNPTSCGQNPTPSIQNSASTRPTIVNRDCMVTVLASGVAPARPANAPIFVRGIPIRPVVTSSPTMITIGLAAPFMSNGPRVRNLNISPHRGIATMVRSSFGSSTVSMPRPPPPLVPRYIASAATATMAAMNRPPLIVRALRPTLTLAPGLRPAAPNGIGRLD